MSERFSHAVLEAELGSVDCFNNNFQTVVTPRIILLISVFKLTANVLKASFSI